jgi:lysophospholipase L1-like esterase
MSKVITVLGDSLAMLRAEYNILLNDIYSFKLAEKLRQDYLLVNKARRANIITEQTNKQFMYDEVLNNNTDIFIIALGICDCAPRIFSRKQEHILRSFLPAIVSKYIIKIKSRYRYFFTKNFPQTWVSLECFKVKYEYLVQKILEQSNYVKIYIINIADTNNENNNRSYGFRENILKYNAVLENIANKYSRNIEIIDFYTLTQEKPELLLDDGIHITKDAHDLLAEILYTKITEFKV